MFLPCAFIHCTQPETTNYGVLNGVSVKCINNFTSKIFLHSLSLQCITASHILLQTAEIEGKFEKNDQHKSNIACGGA